jgi:hypothetical protein
VLCVSKEFQFFDLRIGEATSPGGALVPGEVDVSVDGE